jgi:hypothetical protein
MSYDKWQWSIPNSHKIYQYFLLQGPPKYTQIEIFGIKINHLATLPHVKESAIISEPNVRENKIYRSVYVVGESEREKKDLLVYRPNGFSCFS